MSSRFFQNGSPNRPGLARTGDGAIPINGISKPIAKSPQSPHPDGEDAIRLLTTELRLTPRQAEVLHWIAKGKTNEEISKILACSFHTVKTHIREIFQRLDVTNRAGAIAAAYSMFYELLLANSPSAVRAIPEHGKTTNDRRGSGKSSRPPA
jgi:DNA-binding CsgD family transcriptional regulator